jgi:non-ribosomal peptide synthetase component F
MTMTPEQPAPLLERDANIAGQFDRVAKQFPDRVAVVADRVWRYGELRERVAAYARGFAALGLASETTVAVLLARDGDMVAILLAAMWNGLAYAPIDPDDPPERGRRILEAAGCRLVIAEALDLRALTEAGAEAPGALMLTP